MAKVPSLTGFYNRSKSVQFLQSIRKEFKKTQDFQKCKAMAGKFVPTWESRVHLLLTFFEKIYLFESQNYTERNRKGRRGREEGEREGETERKREKQKERENG